MAVVKIAAAVLIFFLAFSPARADEPADQLLAKVEATLANVTTWTADFSGKVYDNRPGRPSVTFSGTFRLMKPNYADITCREQHWNGDGTLKEERVFVCTSDGTNVCTFNKTRNEYDIDPAFPDGGNVEGSHYFSTRMYFVSRIPHTDVAPRYAGTTNIDERTFEVLEFLKADKDPAKPPFVRQRAFIGADGLVHRYINEQVNGLYVSVWELRNIRTNTPMTASSFAFATPAGGARPRAKTSLPVLAPGTPAPDITVHDKQGKSLKLSDFRGKVVLLDFWSTRCGPCIQSLPHENALLKRFNGAVVGLAVDVDDEKETFDKWLSRNPQHDQFIFALDPKINDKYGAAAKSYLVEGLPAQYVIDRQGHIVKGFFGYEAATLEAALKTALVAETSK